MPVLIITVLSLQVPYNPTRRVNIFEKRRRKKSQKELLEHLEQLRG